MLRILYCHFPCQCRQPRECDIRSRLPAAQSSSGPPRAAVCRVSCGRPLAALRPLARTAHARPDTIRTLEHARRSPARAVGSRASARPLVTSRPSVALRVPHGHAQNAQPHFTSIPSRVLIHKVHGMSALPRLPTESTLFLCALASSGAPLSSSLDAIA